ncbi:IS1182 family transposase, partial [Pasteurellaceae bacterium Phil11]
MLKPPPSNQSKLEMVTLEQLVPKDHLVRKIDQAIDFEFIRDEVAHLYCHNNGRPAIDPVRLFKMMLLGYIFGIKSERQLVKEVEVNMAYRWFLRMTITEKVIDASTLSQNRLRRFNGTDVFERIFTHIIFQAIEKGVVGGKHWFTDSTHLKANANKNKATNERREIKASAYLEMLNADIDVARLRIGKKSFEVKEDAEPKLKNTKVSRTDAESGFMTRDNKPQGFFYLDHRTVDGKCGIILDTFVTPGNVNDSQPYIRRLDATTKRLGFKPKQVGLDAGYFTAPVAESLERREIAGVFGYRRPPRTKNNYKKSKFNYDVNTDTYRCPQGETLIFRTISRDGYRSYSTYASTCLNCSARSDCTKSQTGAKVITRHLYADAIDRANTRRLSEQGKVFYKRRAETVERSFADAKQHHNHRYARFRGVTKVQIQC